jgi:phosphohistidine phosphatase
LVNAEAIGMKLLFLRHGIAEESAGWRGKDYDRPLTDEGRQLLAREAACIAALDLGLEAIVSSPLPRAFETAEIVARRLGMLAGLRREEKLGPGFDLRRLGEILDDHSSAKAVMLVGHEPSFSRTIADLIGGGRLHCKKGSLACVRLEESAPPRGDLEWLIPPGFLAR